MTRDHERIPSPFEDPRSLRAARKKSGILIGFTGPVQTDYDTGERHPERFPSFETGQGGTILLPTTHTNRIQEA